MGTLEFKKLTGELHGGMEMPCAVLSGAGGNVLFEDAQALADRKADWAASLSPRGAAEQRIVDDAVEYSWLRDRARRAQEAQLAAKRPRTYNSLIDAAADREKCFAPFELGRART